jgi:hypothetical protein
MFPLGATTQTCRPLVGGRRRSTFDRQSAEPDLDALDQAARYGLRNQQVAIWDRAERSWAIAVYDIRTKRLHPLDDREAATVLNRDPLIRREWRKCNAMTGNHAKEGDPPRAGRALRGGGAGRRSCRSSAAGVVTAVGAPSAAAADSVRAYLLRHGRGAAPKADDFAWASVRV